MKTFALIVTVDEEARAVRADCKSDGFDPVELANVMAIGLVSMERLVAALEKDTPLVHAGALAAIQMHRAKGMPEGSVIGFADEHRKQGGRL